MTANTVSKALEKRSIGPGALIAQYSADFASVLPTHIKAEMWVRLAQGALKKGKRIAEKGPNQGKFELEVAAANNPGVFLSSLLDAARLGLEPGTEQYYLTPRKVKGRLEILGIIGYQGHIELMYRAGAVSSIVAEVVYTGDKFRFQPGRDEIPDHHIDWDAEDRGLLRLVYAYARMKDGAISKVIVLNKAAINRIKVSAQGVESEYSPWKNHEAAMWLKSAVRQLQKWVPTSAEYRREQLRAAVEADSLRATHRLPSGSAVDSATGDVLDGEIVDEATEAEAEPDQHALSSETGEVLSDPQRTKIHTLFGQIGWDDRADKLRAVAGIVGRPVGSSGDLTKAEAVQLIDVLEQVAQHGDPPTRLGELLDAAEQAEAKAQA